MTDDETTVSAGRRAILGSLAGGLTALAGCTDGGQSTPTATTARTTGTPTEELAGDPEAVQPLDEGIDQWGQRLNDHAREADIDWAQFDGEDIELTFGMALHPYSVTFSRENSEGRQVKDYFEELTGITVEYEIVSEDQFWLETEDALASDDNPYDGVMCNLWPAGGYHYGTDGDAWVRDLTPYIDDASLTDTDWLAMDDFLDQTIELLTFPDGEGGEDFVGLPNTVEVFGCVALHTPTVERLGISDPTDFEELAEAARIISESDDVDREGIVSRTSSETLSSANWGTMFKTYGADWIDRERKEATLNAPEGVASLEQFAGMLRDSGPQNPGTYDWYANHNHYANEDVGMLYGSPQSSGIVGDDVMRETRWLAPLAGPDGESPVVNTSIWSTAIAATTDHPEAAWLFAQWANSREANLMLSTRQWEGDDPRAGFARFDYVADQIAQDNAPPILGTGYVEATRTALEHVPGGDPDEHPPIPADTPQAMNVMSEAAIAMNAAIMDEHTAQAALDEAAENVTEFAEQIPDYYL